MRLVVEGDLCSHHHDGAIIQAGCRWRQPACHSYRAGPDNELGALTFAPSSTPTPRRSTSSPPSQPVTSAIPTATAEITIGTVPGASGAPRRSHQLTAKSPTTTTLPPPCSRPMRFARVPAGGAGKGVGAQAAGGG